MNPQNLKFVASALLLFPGISFVTLAEMSQGSGNHLVVCAILLNTLGKESLAAAVDSSPQEGAPSQGEHPRRRWSYERRLKSDEVFRFLWESEKLHPELMRRMYSATERPLLGYVTTFSVMLGAIGYYLATTNPQNLPILPADATTLVDFLKPGFGMLKESWVLASIGSAMAGGYATELWRRHWHSGMPLRSWVKARRTLASMLDGHKMPLAKYTWSALIHPMTFHSVVGDAFQSVSQLGTLLKQDETLAKESVQLGTSGLYQLTQTIVIDAHKREAILRQEIESTQNIGVKDIDGRLLIYDRENVRDRHRALQNDEMEVYELSEHRRLVVLSHEGRPLYLYFQRRNYEADNDFRVTALKDFMDLPEMQRVQTQRSGEPRIHGHQSMITRSMREWILDSYRSGGTTIELDPVYVQTPNSPRVSIRKSEGYRK